METVFTPIFDRFWTRINTEPEMPTKEIARLFVIAADMREGLLEPLGPDEEAKNIDKPGTIFAIKEFTRILVTLNYNAQRKINPRVEMPSLEDQIKEALENKGIVEAIVRLEKMK